VRSLILALCVACGAPSPETELASRVTPRPTEAEAVPLPVVTLDVASELHTTPAPYDQVANPSVAETRALLVRVVRDNARDPNNPWAIGHSLLALGPGVQLTNDRDAVDWLFSEYAESIPQGGETGVAFPKRRGEIRVEPHTALVLKALGEVGVAPSRVVEVNGQQLTVAHLYRTTLLNTWVKGAEHSFSSWNDTPWALQALSAWAPSELSWTASNGMEMNLNVFVHEVVQRLHHENEEVARAMAGGAPFEKRGQGIFAYTCGGAHLLQGAAYGVGRGFGEPSDRAVITAQPDLLFHRLHRELEIVDQALSEHPEYALLLVEQRLKFLGHFLESAHKLAAMGFFHPSEVQKTELDLAMVELISTVELLHQMGVFDRMDDVRATNEQTWLDVMGDSAHAIRGVDLALGTASVRL